jgi:hypothetical protein
MVPIETDGLSTVCLQWGQHARPHSSLILRASHRSKSTWSSGVSLMGPSVPDPSSALAKAAVG